MAATLMQSALRRLFMLLAGLQLSVALASPVEGVAPFDGNIPAARDAAIADALQNAALFNGSSVRAIALKDGDQVAEAQQIRSGAAPGSYTLLREWQAGGLYYVEIEPGKPAPTALAQKDAQKAQSTKTAATQPATEQQAQNTCAAASYRRRALISPFWLSQPSQANDLSQANDGLKQLLVDRLGNTGRFLAVSAPNELPFAPVIGIADPQLQPDQVRQLARRYGVQFVVGGIVRDLSTEGETYRPAYGQEVRPGERKLGLGLPLWNWLGVGIKAMPSARNVDIELYLFDGVSGALVTRHRAQQVASGDVLGRQGQPVNSASFVNSGIGHTITATLDQLAAQLASDVSCIPFSSRITRVEGRRVYLDAGALAGLAPGDKLQLYRLRNGQSVESGNGDTAQRLGMVEDLAGSLSILQVQPLFAIAQPDGGQAEVGDFARFVSTGKAK
ncbi:flagella assembly protein FlgT middle domain-containing protein [Andreprevotia chitinilytica]|uniref:flagella assembly protein FlgT middle domain-containing protein n=1 Tax=Andreprevotia chitinilytica TaxID=396808 RepID=UPI00054FDE17|nr:flagella assembly protein FlgT middle domain-containing protein [Andreprevotia chitinilytica]